MKDQFKFTWANQRTAESFMERSGGGIFNFLNLYSVYLFRREPSLARAVSLKNCHNFIDGMAPCLFLSLKKFKRISRLSGPVFTRNYFSKLKDKRILIIGDCDSSERKKLSTKFNLQLKDIFCYNSLPFIAPRVQFERKDILKLSAFIKRINPDIIFVCVGNPRQEILAADLLKYHKNKKFLCIGAALDFILGRKEEAPKMIRELGLEWFYRLATDFNYSKKKVWRSLLGLAYLSDIELKD